VKDSKFKELNHPIADGYVVTSSGQAVAQGYKPDITVSDQNGCSGLMAPKVPAGCPLLTV
jgi:hypothetical protein